MLRRIILLCIALILITVMFLSVSFSEELSITTDIANKIKLEPDYAPGMVTVLYGSDLEARGVHSAWEALGMIPGMLPSIERNGISDTTVRGATRAIDSNDIKIMLNGVPLTTPIGPSPAANMPMVLIERIEVIRGPGSHLFGEFACFGVVNIVTYGYDNYLKYKFLENILSEQNAPTSVNLSSSKEAAPDFTIIRDTRIFGRAGSYDTWLGGGMTSFYIPKYDLNLSLNLGGMKTDGADMTSGNDTLYGRGQGVISNAPGPANEDMDYRSGIFTLNYRDFFLNAHYLKSGQGDFFGMNYALPLPEDKIILKAKQWGITTGHKFDFTGTLTSDFKVGFQKQRLEVDNTYLYPYGFFLNPLITYQNGMIYGVNYEERRYDGELNFVWKGWEDHTSLLGLAFMKIEQENARLETNFDTVFPYWPLDHTATTYGPDFGFDDLERSVYSLIFQDYFEFNDDLAFTTGFRYDYYSDVGKHFSPRLAAVYRMTDKHIFKAQYAGAFSPPRFTHMYSDTMITSPNHDLNSEIFDTYEFSYIFKQIRTSFRSTLFYSNIDDIIREEKIEGRVQFQNSGEARLQGVELEFEQGLIPDALELEANLSYVDTDESGHDIAESANWLANVGLMYQPHHMLALNLQYRYVGERNREIHDERPGLDEYHTIDITANIFNLIIEGLTLRAGIKNLFDEDVRYPAPMDQFLSNPPHPSYPDDYPRPGRTWWVQVCHTF